MPRRFSIFCVCRDRESFSAKASLSETTRLLPPTFVGGEGRRSHCQHAEDMLICLVVDKVLEKLVEGFCCMDELEKNACQPACFCLLSER